MKEKNQLRKFLNIPDVIYTVSNNSLQKILEFTDREKIYYFYPYPYLITYKQDKLYNYTEKEDYGLFLSANRPFKNFYNTLKGFLKYLITNRESSLNLHVTGLSEIKEKQLELEKLLPFEEKYKNCEKEIKKQEALQEKDNLRQKEKMIVKHIKNKERYDLIMSLMNRDQTAFLNKCMKLSNKPIYVKKGDSYKLVEDNSNDNINITEIMQKRG